MSDFRTGQNPSALDGVAPDADERTVHALILHSAEKIDGDDRRNRRVMSVMDAVRQIIERSGVAPSSDENPPMIGEAAAAVGRRKNSLVYLLSAVAAGAIAIAVFMLHSPPNGPAMATVPDLLSALDRPGDRRFEIKVDPADPREKHGLDGATLYLRNHDQYLLVRRTPKEREIFDGFDGRESWRIRGGAIVERQSGLGAGGLPMPRSMSEIPFGDLRATIARIAEDYKIAEFAIERSAADAAPRRRLVAEKSDEKTKGPRRIEILADARTGLPERIDFIDAKFQGSPTPRRLTFTLAGEGPQPADFFSAERHVEKR